MIYRWLIVCCLQYACINRVEWLLLLLWKSMDEQKKGCHMHTSSMTQEKKIVRKTKLNHSDCCVGNYTVKMGHSIHRVCVCFTLKSRWNDATVRRTCIYIDKNLSLPVSFDFLSVSANAPPPLVCKMVFFCIIVYVCPTFFSYWIYKSFVTVLSCFMSQILFHDGKRFAKNTQTTRIAMKNNKAKAKICSLLEMNRNMYDCFCLKYSIWILWNGPKMLSFPVDGNLLRTFRNCSLYNHCLHNTIIAIDFFLVVSVYCSFILANDLLFFSP